MNRKERKNTLAYTRPTAANTITRTAYSYQLKEKKAYSDVSAFFKPYQTPLYTDTTYSYESLNGDAVLYSNYSVNPLTKGIRLARKNGDKMHRFTGNGDQIKTFIENHNGSDGAWEYLESGLVVICKDEQYYIAYTLDGFNFNKYLGYLPQKPFMKKYNGHIEQDGPYFNV